MPPRHNVGSPFRFEQLQTVCLELRGSEKRQGFDARRHRGGVRQCARTSRSGRGAPGRAHESNKAGGAPREGLLGGWRERPTVRRRGQGRDGTGRGRLARRGAGALCGAAWWLGAVDHEPSYPTEPAEPRAEPSCLSAHLWSMDALAS